VYLYQLSFTLINRAFHVTKGTNVRNTLFVLCTSLIISWGKNDWTFTGKVKINVKYYTKMPVVTQRRGRGIV